MAIFHNLQLMSLAVLLLASQLHFANAGIRLFGLHARDLKSSVERPDAYLKIWCGATFGGMTHYIKNNSNPTWSTEFGFPNCKENENVQLEVWDHDIAKDDHLGTCYFQVKYGSGKGTCYLSKGTVFYSYEAK
ncbi:Perforin-1 [Anabarilius grahami]|uniref:Perforin-1 n=1 Tax=Anabarilius grahami TaxID=495550 RepID=A0A3N0Z323_ANAGA|nr:Perforin-1 [Anabarilius grahami]